MVYIIDGFFSYTAIKNDLVEAVLSPVYFVSHTLYYLAFLFGFLFILLLFRFYIIGILRVLDPSNFFHICSCPGKNKKKF